LEPLRHPTQAQRSDFGAEFSWFGALATMYHRFFWISIASVIGIKSFGQLHF
jgi:hypothetical protein